MGVAAVTPVTVPPVTVPAMAVARVPGFVVVRSPVIVEAVRVIVSGQGGLPRASSRKVVTGFRKR